MPAGVLRAYSSYMDRLSLRLCLANGLGAMERHRCGSPQGCPFSMMLVALLSRPWMLTVRRAGAIPRVLADDTR
eukprot:11226280-Lingulodinium_polyedra.AAC.1